MQSNRHTKATTLACGLALACLLGGQAAHAATLAALKDGTSIVWISTDEKKVTGSVALENNGRIVGFDVRPADGKLYGVTPDGAIVIIDAMSGKWEKKSQLTEKLPADAMISIDFNPVADRMRILTSTGMSLRINVDDGKAVVDGMSKYAETDANKGKAPKVMAAAYSNSFAGTKETALYDIDATNGRICGAWQSPGGSEFGWHDGATCTMTGSASEETAMRITAIKAWQVDLPLREGRYSWSNGNFVEVFDSTVVAVETDAGITGYAECCPLGSAYLPAYAEGVRAGLEEIGPKLIGLDPRDLGVAEPAHGRGAARPRLRQGADRHRLLGHPGQGGRAAGLQAARRRGAGRRRALPRDLADCRPRRWRATSPATAPRATPSSSSRSAATPTTTSPASAPCRAILQPGDVLVADANTGWTMARSGARRVRRRATSTSTSSSRARPTRSACRSAGAPSLPFVLDEVIDGIDDLVRGIADDAMDVINLKISKVGGLTKARLMRDLCVAAGIPMTIEDTWGGDIVTAADRPSRALDAGRVLLLGDRLQQLRHGDDRRRRAEARRRPHDRLRQARPRHRAGDECAGQAGADRGQAGQSHMTEGQLWR